VWGIRFGLAGERFAPTILADADVPDSLAVSNGDDLFICIPNEEQGMVLIRGSDFLRHSRRFDLLSVVSVNSQTRLAEVINMGFIANFNGVKKCGCQW
jgi:hypothetical protein